jgi:hypothetical protein
MNFDVVDGDHPFGRLSAGCEKDDERRMVAGGGFDERATDRAAVNAGSDELHARPTLSER